MRSALAVLVTVMAITLAGCSGTSNPPADAPTPGPHPASPTGSPAPPGHPAGNATGVPVDITDSGDIAQGFTKDYSWNVTPGFTRFDVTIDVTGPQGAPTFEATGLYSILTGGSGDNRTAKESGGATSVNGGSPRNFFAFTGDATAPAGPWNLHFEAKPSAAAFALHVTVAY